MTAALQQKGALQELRPGPWMLAAADDPVALPSEEAAQANTDHLLRVRRCLPPWRALPAACLCCGVGQNFVPWMGCSADPCATT